MTTNEKLFYLLADNQDVTRAGLRHYIDTGQGVSAVTVEVPNENSLIEELSKHQTAVVVLDYTLFDIRSVADVINLRLRYPRSQWVMFSNELTQEAIRRFSAEDGMSLVLKDNSEEEIKSALKCASRGERFICHQITNLLIEERTQQSNSSKLTPTEIEVLKLIAHGRTVKEIANERNSSVHTIITHKKNIFRKIEVNNVYEATKYALHAGLIDLMEYYI